MRQLKTLLTVIGAVTVLVLAGNTIALATTGQGFITGRSNTASTLTSLTRTTSGTALKVTTKRAGNAPFAVNGTGKVTHLNADMVDGIDSSALRTHSYVFTSTFANKSSVNLTLPLPNGSYLITYSNFFDGLGTSSIQCYVITTIGTNSVYTAYEAANFTAGNYSPAMSGAGLATKTAGSTIKAHCDSAGSNWSTFPGGTLQVVATPTTIVSTSALTAARVAPRRQP
jgi:hypothetical protein